MTVQLLLSLQSVQLASALNMTHSQINTAVPTYVRIGAHMEFPAAHVTIETQLLVEYARI